MNKNGDRFIFHQSRDSKSGTDLFFGQQAIPEDKTLQKTNLSWILHSIAAENKSVPGFAQSPFSGG
jgi:hypothetical protein